MRSLVGTLNAMTKAHPGWTLVGVILVAGAFVLPSLHHVFDHHSVGDAGDSCPVCLLLKLNVLALPLVVALAMARRNVTLLTAEIILLPAAAVVLRSFARGPPLSH